MLFSRRNSQLKSRRIEKQIARQNSNPGKSVLPVPGFVRIVAAVIGSSFDETLTNLSALLFMCVVQVPLMLPDGKT
jgi:hypothetical protein